MLMCDIFIMCFVLFLFVAYFGWDFNVMAAAVAAPEEEGGGGGGVGGGGRGGRDENLFFHIFHIISKFNLLFFHIFKRARKYTCLSDREGDGVTSSG